MQHTFNKSHQRISFMAGYRKPSFSFGRMKTGGWTVLPLLNQLVDVSREQLEGL